MPLSVKLTMVIAEILCQVSSKKIATHFCVLPLPVFVVTEVSLMRIKPEQNQNKECSWRRLCGNRTGVPCCTDKESLHLSPADFVFGQPQLLHWKYL